MDIGNKNICKMNYLFITKLSPLIRVFLVCDVWNFTSDFFKRQFCDAHTCKKKKLKIYPRGSGVFDPNTVFSVNHGLK
jgi:hypothetical protein